MTSRNRRELEQVASNAEIEAPNLSFVVACRTVPVVVLAELRFALTGFRDQWPSALLKALDGRAARLKNLRVHPDSGKLVLVLDE